MLIDRGTYTGVQVADARCRPGWLRAGACRTPGAEEKLLPTLTRALPRKKPPRAPAGLERVDGDVITRWTNDAFRYPVYQYQSQFMVSEDGCLRTPMLGRKGNLNGFLTLGIRRLVLRKTAWPRKID